MHGLNVRKKLQHDKITETWHRKSLVSTWLFLEVSSPGLCLVYSSIRSCNSSLVVTNWSLIFSLHFPLLSFIWSFLVIYTLLHPHQFRSFLGAYTSEMHIDSYTSSLPTRISTCQRSCLGLPIFPRKSADHRLVWSLGGRIVSRCWERLWRNCDVATHFQPKQPSLGSLIYARGWLSSRGTCLHEEKNGPLHVAEFFEDLYSSFVKTTGREN